MKGLRGHVNASTGKTLSHKHESSKQDKTEKAKEKAFQMSLISLRLAFVAQLLFSGFPQTGDC
jgi:hypothetical protein